MLGIADPILRALAAENYLTPTPIQAQAIPLILAGRDVLGLAQTGTGKTAAFGLPLLQRLSQDQKHVLPKCVRALILAPTRELAIQIHESLKTYGRHLKLRHAVILGGVNPEQAGRRLAPRRGHAGGDTRTPARSDPAETRPPGRGFNAGHRRSRPHVRHGLHPRRAPHRGHAAARAPVDAVLGHHAGRRSRIS